MPEPSAPSGPADWSAWLSNPSSAGVVADYDGTLANITDRRLTVPLPGVREVVASLARFLGVVAIVSGRPVEFLRRSLGDIDGLTLVGLYGLERSQGAVLAVSESAQGWCEVIARVAEAADREAPRGVDVEHKGLALALHTRQHPEHFEWSKQWASERAAGTGLVAQPGRLSVELLPPVVADKGTVVRDLAVGLDAIAFFGDDTGDLPAFGALGELRASGKATLAVGVRSAEQPEALASAVDLLVDNPVAAVELLRTLAAALACRMAAGPCAT